MRSSKKYWRVQGQPDTKVRSELDQPTDDRIAMQPYYALLDILAQVTGQPDLQTWKQTLQIWTGREASTQKLLAQVAYVLDGRYARRYCCLLMIDDEYYDQVLAKWHEAFSDRMRRTMMLVQALRRAVVDKTTTSRSSFDKAFDVSNNSAHLANFPYPMFPMKISTELGRLLESHPTLPFQQGGKKSIVHQVQICLACTCALGYNLDCQECYNSPVPPGFYSKASAPVKSLICPASVQDGSICGSPLGINHKCDLCKEHRKYWSS